VDSSEGLQDVVKQALMAHGVEVSSENLPALTESLVQQLPLITANASALGLRPEDLNKLLAASARSGYVVGGSLDPSLIVPDDAIDLNAALTESFTKTHEQQQQQQQASASAKASTHGGEVVDKGRISAARREEWEPPQRDQSELGFADPESRPCDGRGISEAEEEVDRLKAAANTEFKAGRFSRSIELYTDAITHAQAQRLTPSATLHSNRSAAYSSMNHHQVCSRAALLCRQLFTATCHAHSIPQTDLLTSGSANRTRWRTPSLQHNSSRAGRARITASASGSLRSVATTRLTRRSKRP